MSEKASEPDTMALPGFTITRKPASGKCELVMCVPAGEGSHEVLFANGKRFVICDRHAVGIVGLGEALAHLHRVREAEEGAQ